MPSTGNILDVAQQGEKDSRSECPLQGVLNAGSGVSGTVEGHGRVGSGLDAKPSAARNSVHAGQPSENQASPTDSQINQGLTIERLIHAVVAAEEHAAEIEQYRAEEEAAAEEGALIEASNMPYPEYERNGR